MSRLSKHIAAQFREKAKELRRHARGRRRTAILGFARDFEILADLYEQRLRAKATTFRPTA